MRMPSALTTLLAVLCGAGVAGDVLTNASRVRRTPQSHHPHRVLMDVEPDVMSWKKSHWREMQSILLHEASKHSSGVSSGVECCPTVHEMTAPKGGRTLSGLFVELYRDGENKQQLYDISCAKGVVDKPCRFVDARLYNQSRCVQRYSYSYALVRNPAAPTETPHRHRREGQMSFRDGEITVPGGWSMDYVQVRSGCECQIFPIPKRKSQHKKKLERHKQGRRNKEAREKRRVEEDDDT